MAYEKVSVKFAFSRTYNVYLRDPNVKIKHAGCNFGVFDTCLQFGRKIREKQIYETTGQKKIASGPIDNQMNTLPEEIC